MLVNTLSIKSAPRLRVTLYRGEGKGGREWRGSE